MSDLCFSWFFEAKRARYPVNRVAEESRVCYLLSRGGSERENNYKSFDGTLLNKKTKGFRYVKSSLNATTDYQ